MSALGRRAPTSWEHVERHPLGALPTPAAFEKSLGLPWWWKTHDQGDEGSCVGFGCSAMMSVTNHYQRFLKDGSSITFRYAPRWLYAEAQLVDEWDDTPPGEGTSVKAGCDILRTRGHRRVQNTVTGPVNMLNGISANKWATTVDELRGAIYSGMACAIGVNWYSNFDDPVVVDNERWIGKGGLGFIRGGHCLCVYAASDRRQAFKLMNSWGADYAPVWIPYTVMQRLIAEDGEATCIVDR